MNIEQRQVTADRQAKPTADSLLPSTPTIAIYYYSARKPILIYCLAEGRRLSGDAEIAGNGKCR